MADIEFKKDYDWAILPTLKLGIDRVKVSNELSSNMEKIIRESERPIDTLDKFLFYMHCHSQKHVEHFNSPEGATVMSMEAILMRAVLYLWSRCPTVQIRHIRQALGMIPMAVRGRAKDSVMHAPRGVPDWWPNFQHQLFKDIHQCFYNIDVTSKTCRRHIDATFGYRLIFLSCFMTDQISPMNIGNYCLEEAKLLEILITAIGKLDQRAQYDDQYLSEVIKRIFSANRPIHYNQTIANAAFFLNGMARMLIKEKIFIALRDQSDHKPYGMHAKKIAMLNLSKLLLEYMPYAPTMKEILHKIISLCSRLELARKLVIKQRYSLKEHDCLPTCLDLAFPSVLDDQKSYKYICEFTYFCDVMRYIRRKNIGLLRELTQSLETEQAFRLDFYRNKFEPRSYSSLPDRETCQFQCVNHRFQPEDSNICSLLNREYLIKRPKEAHDA